MTTIELPRPARKKITFKQNRRVMTHRPYFVGFFLVFASLCRRQEKKELQIDGPERGVPDLCNEIMMQLFTTRPEGLGSKGLQEKAADGRRPFNEEAPRHVDNAGRKPGFKTPTLQIHDSPRSGTGGGSRISRRRNAGGPDHRPHSESSQRCSRIEERGGGRKKSRRFTGCGRRSTNHCSKKFCGVTPALLSSRLSSTKGIPSTVAFPSPSFWTHSCCMRVVVFYFL
jgi:hypothetical protein